MKKLRLTVTAIFLLVALLVTGMPALAASLPDYVFAKDIITLYKTASTSSEIGRITVATRLIVKGESGDYYKVVTRTGGHEGYVKKSSTVRTAPECPTEIAYANESSVPVYKHPNTTDGKWQTLSRNTQVKIVGESGSYYAVTKTDDIIVGYVAKSKLSKTKTSGATSGSDAKFTEKVGYAASIIPLYKTASTDNELYRITVATRLNVKGESGSFYKVVTRTGSHEGYVKKSDVVWSAPACPTTVTYVNANNVVTYKKASSSAAQWKTFSRNDQVKIVGENGSYYAITTMNDVIVGYIPKDKTSSKWVSATAAPTAANFTEKVGYAASIIPLYKTASTDNELYRITVATRLNVKGESGSYYKVVTRTGSHEGYVKKSDVVWSAPACPTTVTYVNANNVVTYKKASSSAAQWKTFSRNDQVKIVGENGSYYAITTMNDVIVGYIPKDKTSSKWVSATAAPTAANFTEKVGYAAGIIPLYKTASTDSELYHITVATRLNIKGESGSFYKVVTRTGGHEGYVKKSDVCWSVPACPTTVAYVAANNVVARKRASSSAAAWKTFGLNDQLKIVGENGSYYAVTAMEDVVVGYIEKSLMSNKWVSATAAPTATPSATATNSPTPAPTAVPTATPFVEKSGYAAAIIPMYKTASTDTELYRVTVATCLDILGESGSFYRVVTRTGSHEGYVKKSDVVWSVPAYTSSVGYAKVDGAIAYKKPTVTADRWQTFYLNDQFKIVGEDDTFYAVTKTDDVLVGYVSKTKVSKTKVSTPAATQPTTSSTPTPSNRGTYQSGTSSTTMPTFLRSTQSKYGSGLSNAQKIEAAIYFAQDHMGCYYASKPDNKNTFDCLTLCYSAYSKVGVLIPSSSYACGYSGSFPYIYDVSQLKRGDIVCFDTLDDNDKSDHVGIYLGSGYFIHCSSGAGMVVVSTMSYGYYKDHFYCGRRVVNT